MKKILLLSAVLLSSIRLWSQELGYMTGASQLGYEAQGFQPLYGFTIGKMIQHHILLESSLYYSQRTYKSDIQADYMSFMLMPQFGWFEKKWGAYAGPTFALNPTLHHSSIKNHTYVSAGLAVGARFMIIKRVWLDGKVMFDKGLSGAYFDNGSYKNYDGIQIHLGMKFDLSCK